MKEHDNDGDRPLYREQRFIGIQDQALTSTQETKYFRHRHDTSLLHFYTLYQ